MKNRILMLSLYVRLHGGLQLSSSRKYCWPYCSEISFLNIALFGVYAGIIFTDHRSALNSEYFFAHMLSGLLCLSVELQNKYPTPQTKQVLVHPLRCYNYIISLEGLFKHLLGRTW